MMAESLPVKCELEEEGQAPMMPSQQQDRKGQLSAADQQDLKGQLSAADQQDPKGQLSAADQQDLKGQLSAADQQDLKGQLSAADQQDPKGQLSAADQQDPKGQLSAADQQDLKGQLLTADQQDPKGQLSAADQQDLKGQLLTADQQDPKGQLSAADQQDLKGQLLTADQQDPKGQLSAADQQDPEGQLSAADQQDPKGQLSAADQQDPKGQLSAAAVPDPNETSDTSSQDGVLTEKILKRNFMVLSNPAEEDYASASAAASSQDRDMREQQAGEWHTRPLTEPASAGGGQGQNVCNAPAQQAQDVVHDVDHDEIAATMYGIHIRRSQAEAGRKQAQNEGGGVRSGRRRGTVRDLRTSWERRFGIFARCEDGSVDLHRARQECIGSTLCLCCWKNPLEVRLFPCGHGILCRHCFLRPNQPLAPGRPCLICTGNTERLVFSREMLNFLIERSQMP